MRLARLRYSKKNGIRKFEFSTTKTIKMEEKNYEKDDKKCNSFGVVICNGFAVELIC
jgi:hypothetical protein